MASQSWFWKKNIKPVENHTSKNLATNWTENTSCVNATFASIPLFFVKVDNGNALELLWNRPCFCKIDLKIWKSYWQGDCVHIYRFNLERHQYQVLCYLIAVSLLSTITEVVASVEKVTATGCKERLLIALLVMIDSLFKTLKMCSAQHMMLTFMSEVFSLRNILEMVSWKMVPKQSSSSNKRNWNHSRQPLTFIFQHSSISSPQVKHVLSLWTIEINSS